MPSMLLRMIVVLGFVVMTIAAHLPIAAAGTSPSSYPPAPAEEVGADAPRERYRAFRFERVSRPPLEGVAEVEHVLEAAELWFSLAPSRPS